MKTDYYNHLKLLVISIEYLSMKLIKKIDLIIVEKLLFKYVKNLDILYSESIITSGFHELVHFVDLVKLFGPLNSLDLFQFEEINRKITKFIKGSDLIAEEFIKIFTLAQNLSNVTNLFDTNNIEIKKFLNRYLLIKTSNRKKTPNNIVQYPKKFIRISHFSITRAIFEYSNIYIYSISITEKAIVNNTPFKTVNNSSKFSNSCVIDKISGNIGLIDKIIYDSENSKNFFVKNLK